MAAEPSRLLGPDRSTGPELLAEERFCFLRGDGKVDALCAAELGHANADDLPGPIGDRAAGVARIHPAGKLNEATFPFSRRRLETVDLLTEMFLPSCSPNG